MCVCVCACACRQACVSVYGHVCVCVCVDRQAVCVYRRMCVCVCVCGMYLLLCVMNSLVTNRYSGESVKLLWVLPPHLLHHRVCIQQDTLTSLHTLVKPELIMKYLFMLTMGIC